MTVSKEKMDQIRNARAETGLVNHALNRELLTRGIIGLNTYRVNRLKLCFVHGIPDDPKEAEKFPEAVE